MPLAKLKQFLDLIFQEIKYDFIIRNRIKQLPIIQELDRLQEKARQQNPKNLVAFGSKTYSQSDEDGIIREIFNRVGTIDKTFIEFGIGNGLENNTLSLLFDGWQGLWIDASSNSIKKIRKHFSKIIESGQLKITQSFITQKNIDDLITAGVGSSEIDLLSIDIDGNDFHILNAITCIQPRVIVIEYNAKFTPPILYCMEYDETHTWKKDDCHGASLKFLEINLDKKGYYLVGCNVSGVNAFFVKKELVSDKFLEPFTAENHYEPPRYYLSGYFAGHPASYETLPKSLRKAN